VQAGFGKKKETQLVDKEGITDNWREERGNR